MRKPGYVLSKSSHWGGLRNYLKQISALTIGRDLLFVQLLFFILLNTLFSINVFALSSFENVERNAVSLISNNVKNTLKEHERFSESLYNNAARYDALISKGLDNCYHFKWEKAEDTFKDIIQKHPASPEGYHYLSSVYFWYYLSSKDENDLNNFTKYSDQAIEKALDELDKDENNASLLYLLGSNYNYRTVAFAKAENYLDAVWAAKKSESYLSECLEADSTFTDAYLGLGLYNFAVANIPSGFKWALNLAGISGEESTGLRYIKITADKGKLAKVEAQYYLSQILSEVIMDYDDASFYLKNLIRKYPENLLFNYSYAAVEMKKRKLDEAEKVLLKIIKEEEPKFSQIISFSHFLLGDINFRRNDFDKSKSYYREFLSTANDKDYTGIASYRLALTYEISGDRNNSQKYFTLSKNGNKDIEDDIYAERKGNIYAKRTLAQNEIEVIKAGNLVESGQYTEAADTLVELLDRVNNNRLKSEVYLLLSEAFFHQKKFDESAEHALSAVKTSTNEEAWVKPFAYFYAAKAYASSGKTREARKYLEMAEDQGGYDYQKKLENMIASLAKKI